MLARAYGTKMTPQWSPGVSGLDSLHIAFSINLQTILSVLSLCAYNC